MIRQMVKVTFLVSIFMILFHGITLAGTVKYTVGGHAAALTEELLDKTVSLSMAKDYQALQKLLDSQMVIVLKTGLKVEVVDTKLFSGKVKIRPFGTTIELWTVIEALRDVDKKDTENAKEKATEKKAKSDGLYSLNVNATPSDSTIKIMNIIPKYEPGIKLKAGKYDVSVAKKGYQKWREWVEIVDSNRSIDVSLEEKKDINAGRVTWSSARKQASERCKKRHESYSLQAGCMRNEERGFKTMQGNSGMPSDIALSAKKRCSSRHESFALQAGCMRNEERGYKSWQGSFDMPKPVAEKSKKRCAARHQSYSLRAGCMRNESRSYSKISSQ